MQFISVGILAPLQELGNIILAWREAEGSLLGFEALMAKTNECRPEGAVSVGLVSRLSDSITEEQITDTIRKLSALQMQITIMIAHRLSTIMHGDTIHVLEKGRVVESMVDSLVEHKGLYYGMWRQQIGERA